MTRCSAAHLAAQGRTSLECPALWTPDKDLAQCVRDDLVVQVDRRSGVIAMLSGRVKFGVRLNSSRHLALVGESADAFPLKGLAKDRRAFINLWPMEKFPPETLNEKTARLLVFKDLATLRIGAPLSTTSRICAGVSNRRVRFVHAKMKPSLVKRYLNSRACVH